MRIVVQATTFYPHLGGLENKALMLCREFVRQGHEVVVVTNTPANATDTESFPFKVCRGGTPIELCKELRCGEVFLQFNVSLWALPALCLAPRPWIVSHESWFSHSPELKTFRGGLKRFVCRFATNICCSEAVRQDVGGNAVVVPNPYDDALFYTQADVGRHDDVLVVARLVSDKGVDIAIKALRVLADRGHALRLTIAGDGPERTSLEALAKEQGVAHLLTFTGAVPPVEVANLMRQHRVLVVPTVWEEPFGIVALEGLACGCRVIVSNCGGLPEAIGKCGVTFSRGDYRMLAERIQDSITGPVVSTDEQRLQHLLRHQAPAVAQRYIEILSIAKDNRK